MSVAFTKEQDYEAQAADLPDRPISPHANLVTPNGLAQIERELAAARAAYSVAQAGGGVAADRTAMARATRDLRYWSARRASAQLVEASAETDVVAFGGQVTFDREDGRRQTDPGDRSRQHCIAGRRDCADQQAQRHNVPRAAGEKDQRVERPDYRRVCRNFRYRQRPAQQPGKAERTGGQGTTGQRDRGGPGPRLELPQPGSGDRRVKRQRHRGRKRRNGDDAHGHRLGRT